MQFESQISINTSAFLKCHRVSEIAIVPATFYLDQALAAGQNVFQSDNLAIKNFVVHQAATIPDNQEVKLEIKLEKQSDNLFVWRIFSLPIDELKSTTAAKLHASGKVVVNETKPQCLQVEVAKKVTQYQNILIADFYQSCRERNIQYGDRFQILEQLFQQDNCALGRVKLDPVLSSQAEQYLLHPVLLDSCFQVLWAALPPDSKGATYLPVGIESIVIHRYPELNQSCWSYSKLSPEYKSVSKILLADLFLLDDQGNPLVELKGVTVERASQEALFNSLQPQQKIAIAASFTAEPIEDSLSFWMEELGIKSTVEFAPYNQIFQELLSPSSLLAQNRDGVNLILLRLEDWLSSKNQLKLLVDAEQKQNILGNQPVHNLPNKIEVAHLNQYETEYLYQELFVDRVYAQHRIALPEDACVVDIGANIGLFTLFIQQECPDATIYSFEPAPHAYEKLESNAALYCQNAQIFNCGLSGENKAETFTFYPNSSVFSGFHADREDDEQAIRAVILNMLEQVNAGEGAELERLADEFMPGRLEVESFQAQLRTLSSVIEEYNIQRIDLVKLDAEKSELPVLQGIKDQHWSLIQQMVVEVHDQEGSTIRQVKQILQARGFELTVVEENLLQGSGLYNIYATRPENASKLSSAESPASKASLEQSVKDLNQALVAAAKSSNTPYLVGLCPPSPQVKDHPELSNFYQEMESLLAVALEQVNSIYLLPTSELTTPYPVADYYDAQGDLSGSVPYTPAYYAALGTAIARKIRALKSPPHKVIVLDCDRTLWNGICGEDGAAGVAIDSPYQKLQEFMVAQSAAGMLLCLCSKNNEEDVWQVFDEQQQMPLQRKHLVQWRINWQAKSENIKSLAQELNLGLDSFIFIDDNPLECAEVRANCPQVLTLQLPEQPAQIPNFLDHVWAFARLQNTAADQQRTTLYQQNIKRESFRQETITFSDFLAGLNLKIEIDPISTQQIARVAQLTQRTNQFNFTTIRRSEGEIQQLLDSGQLECLVVQVSDRFGDYGLVGAILFKTVEQILQVDTFLLSCRALGKGIEHQMLAQLGKLTQERGLESIELNYTSTAKNQPALLFLKNLEAAVKEQTVAGWLFKLPTELAANLTYNPDQTESISAAPQTLTERSSKVNRSQQQITTISRIATELNSPQQILEAIAARQRRVRPAALTAQFVTASNQLEAWLVQIWREVLTMEQIGIHDNFFELGGTSLLMVRVLSKLQAKYPQVTLVDLYQYPTIDAQAKYLTQPQGEQPPAATEEFKAVAERVRRKQDARKQRRQRRGGRV